MDAGTQSRGNGRTGRLMENETDGRNAYLVEKMEREKKRERIHESVEFGYDGRRIAK